MRCARKLHGGGHYIDRDAIERRNPIRTEDLFRTVPGLRLVPSGSFDYSIVSTRGGSGFNSECSPDFYLDGAKITVDASIGGGLPVNPTELYGIEVYSGPGTAPAQYMGGGNSCGVVLLWTRRGENRRVRR